MFKMVKYLTSKMSAMHLLCCYNSFFFQSTKVGKRHGLITALITPKTVQIFKHNEPNPVVSQIRVDLLDQLLNDEAVYYISHIHSSTPPIRWFPWKSGTSTNWIVHCQD